MVSICRTDGAKFCFDDSSVGAGATESRKTNVMESNDKFGRLLKQYGSTLLGLLVLVLVVHDIFGTHGYLAMKRTQNEIRKVQADLDQLNKENVELEQEVRELKTDPHKIEKIARDELGLARPGEVIIKIPLSQRLPQDSSVKP
jgi:cell division protein FtsB